MEIEVLEKRARKLRRDILEMAFGRGKGHIGGAFSIIEILVSLYDKVMTEDDKFILSKGHACLPLYAILKERGFNPKISGHPEIDVKNGIHCTTGSLGHGLPIGVGMALARKLKRKRGNIYILISDAECQEGTTWESLLLAAHYKLDNLVVIVDHNNMQTLGKTSEILSLGEIGKKFEVFGCEVSRVDGHSFDELIQELNKKIYGKPKAIIADTVKGKGVSYMEDVPKWHTMVPNETELKHAYKELE